MDYAKERRSSEKFVSAQDAVPSRYYVCPTCFADVFLRRGRWRVAHFAHRAGTGKPECENFHPSEGFTYAWTKGAQPQASSNYRPGEPLRLGIELQPESMVRGKRSRAWELRVTVPKSEDTRGQITFDCGAGTKPKISLLKLALGSQSYPADVDTEEFGAIWVSPEVRPEYREVVEDRLRGLDRDFLTLFSATQQRIKPRTDRVSWGGGYYAVWHDTFDLRQPRQIVAQPLAKAKNWNCAFIALPDEEDSDVKAWLESAGAISFSPYRRVFGVIYPPPVGYDILGRLGVPTSSAFLIGLRQTENDDDNTSAIRVTTANATAQVALEGAGRHLLRVKVDATKSHLSVSVNDTSLPPIIPTPINPTDIFQSVRVQAHILSSRTNVEGVFGTHECSASLDAIRQNTANLTELTVPSGAIGQLFWKRDDDLTWTTRKLGRQAESAYTIATADELSLLNSVLKDKALEVEIEFEGFGRWTALSERPKEPNRTRGVNPRTRSRIEWILKASAVYADERGVPIRSLSGHALVSLFSRLRASPDFASHQRAISAQISRDSRSEAAP